MYTIERILETKGSEVHVVRRDVHVIDAVDVMCRAHVGAVLVRTAPASPASSRNET